MKYPPGYLAGYVEAVKRDVEMGVFSKEEAIQLILSKVQEILNTLAGKPVDKKQFMMDRKAEVEYERN
jgi:hypothetical protein